MPEGNAKGPHVNTTNIIFAELGWHVFQPACSLWRPLPDGKNLIADVVLAWTMPSFDYIWFTAVKIQVDAGTMSTGLAAWLRPHLWQGNVSGKLGLTLLSHSVTRSALKFSLVHEITFQRGFWYVGGNDRKIGWSWCKGSLKARDLRLWRITPAVLRGHLPAWQRVKPKTTCIQKSNQQQ